MLLGNFGSEMPASTVFGSIIYFFRVYCWPGVCGQVPCRAHLCSMGGLAMSTDSCQAILHGMEDNLDQGCDHAKTLR